MSDVYLAAQLARIRRMGSETEKLREETRKFVSEAQKRDAEARKLERDRIMAPWQVAVVTIVGIAGLIAAIVTAMKSVEII